MIKRLFLIILLSLVVSFDASGEEVKTRWLRVSGKWIISNSSLSTAWENAAFWGSYALLDRNTVLTIDSFNGLTSFSFRVVMTKTKPAPGEFWAAFGTRAPSGNWNYHSYAVVFHCDTEHVNKVALILTDQTDKTKAVNIKNNYHITELAAVPADIKFGVPLDFYLKFEDKTVTIYCNNTLITSFTVPDDRFDGFDGRIGFGSKSVLINMEYAKVTRGSDIIFEDGFDANTLYVPTVEMKVEKTR